MATNFPTSIDSFSNPSGSDVTGLTTGQSTVTHSQQHANANDAIEALEAKVGVNSSTVETSLDYKLTNTSSTNPGHKHTLSDGATDVIATAAELNYSSGVTSAIQDQLDGKASSSALTNHENSTLAHGATGAVVGTTNTQTLTNKTLTSPTLSGDINISGVTDNITVNGSDPYRTIVLTAPALKPTTTGGCGQLTTVEAGTNSIDYQVLDFDASTDEKAFINFNMPDSWDGGTITARFVWTAASGSGDVVWGIQGRAYANDDAIDQSLGTAQTVVDTLTAAGDVCISDATSAVTLAGSPAGGQMVHLRVYRDADAGGDTLAADARLIAVHIEYQVGQFGD